MDLSAPSVAGAEWRKTISRVSSVLSSRAPSVFAPGRHHRAHIRAEPDVLASDLLDGTSRRNQALLDLKTAIRAGDVPYSPF